MRIRNFFQFAVKKSILKIEKIIFLKIFTFQSRINHVWVKQKYSLKVFSKTKLACKQHENKFFLPAQFIWEMFRSKVGKKILHLFFN